MHEIEFIKKNIMAGDVYDIYFYNYIFVPLTYGKTVLPDIDIFIYDNNFEYRTKLKGEIIDIFKLLDSDNVTGALGNYLYKYEISGDTISDDQAVILKQIISGTGNFYGIEMPVPVVESKFVQISLLDDKYEIVPAGRFFEGYREVSYIIKKNRENIYELNPENQNNKNPEKAIVNIPDFTWYEEDSLHPYARFSLHKTEGKRINLNVLFSTASKNKDVNSETIKNNFSYMIFIFTALFLCLMLSALFFFITKNGIFKNIFIIALIFIVILFAIILLRKLCITSNIFGKILDVSPVAVFSIPDETGKIRFYVKKGEQVRIISDKNDFYFIEAVINNNMRGWVKKENILKEDLKK
jgi:hypothetical protein